MRYQTLEYQVNKNVARIILSRPDVNNVINDDLAGELSNICAEITRDQNVRVVTVSGAGKAFCAGTDCDAYPPQAAKQLSVAGPVARLECPVIAVINGDALGQGLELALACDLRIAAETARLGFLQLASGLIPFDGGTQRLPRLIGRAGALEMLLLGATITAGDAYRMGLVNLVVASDDLPQFAAELAEGIALSAPLALKYAKEAVLKGMELALEQGLRFEADLYALLQTTRDRTEGINAYRQKRRPEFKGE